MFFITIFTIKFSPKKESSGGVSAIIAFRGLDETIQLAETGFVILIEFFAASFTGFATFLVFHIFLLFPRKMRE